MLQKGWFSRFFPLEIFDAMKRQQIVSIGSLLFFIFLISPLVVWLSYNPDSIRNPLIALAKFNAFMAISSLSINFFLSTRLKVFDKIFNGLDRMYRVHKLVGRISLFFIILHPIFLMVAKFKQVDVLMDYVLPFGPFDVAIGVISLYIFLVLLSLTVALQLPYHWWHTSHKAFGVVLLFAGLHAFFAGSDIGSFPALRFWIIFIWSLGLVSWFYMLIFYKIVGPRFTVKIDKVDHFEDVTELTFKKPKGFRYQPGQYLFIRFPRFEGYKELFPFSISSDPSQKSMRISVKRSGDFTSKKIPKVQKKDKAIIMGPYGNFGEKYLNHSDDMIWIAGGIGITPFLSLAKHESNHPSGRKILLIWATKDRCTAFHDKELREEMKKNKNFTYISWFSSQKGRLDCDEVEKLINKKMDLKKSKILMCGPSPMVYSLSKGFHKKAVPYHNIVFEDFNMLD